MGKDKSMLFSETKSILLKYMDHIHGIDPKFIERTSIQEGASIIFGKSFDGFKISFLDLSTHTVTGTFKDSIGCIVAAYCLENGIKRFVCSTSGNTGNSLALYASRNKIRATIFYPKISRYKMDPETGNSPYVRFVEVDGPDSKVKEISKAYAEHSKLPLFPTFNHQIEANKIRAYFLMDYIRSTDNYFDWHVQALSGGYGVFGFYKGLEEINSKQFVYCPRFLGVQQKAVSPFYKYFCGEEEPDGNDKDTMIEPTLYASQLNQTLFDEMNYICSHSQGMISRISSDIYQSYEPKILKLFSNNDLNVGYMRGKNELRLIEKAGLVTTAGVIEQFKSKKIKEDSHPLIVISGGMVPDRNTIFEPQWKVSSLSQIEQL